MEWALTGQQQYIDAASQLMDYDQGLNPIGKCYMTGIGFDQTHNPEQTESAYAEYVKGWGGPIPGITVYGPSAPNGPTLTSVRQVPAANGLPRERKWVDNCGSIQWVEFTVEETEVYQSAVYPVLAQGGNWKPANGEPFLNPVASIQSGTNGMVLQFGGIPYQNYVLQTATDINGPWSTDPFAVPVAADVTGTVRFTDASPAPVTEFYRTEYVPPGGAAPGAAPIY